MINTSVPRFPAQPISWADVARICRRICLLRECGRSDEAELVRRGALAEALAAIDPAGNSDLSLEQRLEATFAIEADRVANAAVLAELLAPLVGKQLQSRDSSATGPNQSVAIAPDLAADVAPTQPASLHVPPPRADPTDLAHFIDDMLAQERASAGRRDVRRAS